MIRLVSNYIAFIPLLNSNNFDTRLNFTRHYYTFDWGHISPSIFGSMFQAAMSEEKRHELGAHYTEESNILKIVEPLFMNELNAEFELVKTNKNKLKVFHDKLAGLKFLDPACGTGNFLIISYRELRRLEIKILEALYMTESSFGGTIQMVLEAEQRAKVNVDQFFGIEIDEFACEIARLGMWLMDHQCNLELSKAMGMYYVRLPLSHAATIVHGNALRIDWNSVVPKRELMNEQSSLYILGNPPFVGYSLQSEEQKADILSVYLDKNNKPYKNSGKIDYVAAWYYKAAKYMMKTDGHSPYIRGICFDELNHTGRTGRGGLETVIRYVRHTYNFRL